MEGITEFYHLHSDCPFNFSLIFLSPDPTLVSLPLPIGNHSDLFLVHLLFVYIPENRVFVFCVHVLLFYVKGISCVSHSVSYFTQFCAFKIYL